MTGGTLTGNVTVNNVYEVAKSIGYVDNQDSIIKLCPAGQGAANNVQGTIFLERSSGAYNIEKVSFGYSAGSSTANYSAYLETIVGTYQNTVSHSLVKFTHGGIE